MKSGKKKDNIWSKFIEVLEYVRKTKSEAKKSMKSEIILSLNKSDSELLKDCLNDLKAVSCAKKIRLAEEFNVEFV